MKEMNFTHSFTWSYNPWGIISKKRVENKSTAYIHTQRPEIEKYMNQIGWMPDTLQEPEEQVISSSSAQTPRQQEKQTTEDRTKKGKEQEQEITRKRPREDSHQGLILL